MKKLPVVSADTVLLIRKELQESESNDAFSAEVLMRLSDENPNIAYTITKAITEVEDCDNVALCAAIVYRLLEAETEGAAIKPQGLLN